MSKILIVDDEPDIIFMLEKLLEAEGYSVIGADGGKKALKMIEENPDLVLLDIMMPGMNGIEVLRALKERSPDIAVIMITAYASMDSAIEAMHLGAYYYLKKPLENEKLKLVVKNALEKRRLEREILELKEFNEEIVKSMNEGVVVLDERCQITFANPKAEEILGRENGGLVDLRWIDVISPDYRKLAESRIGGPPDGKERYEVTLLKEDGEAVFVIVGSTPLYEDGRYNGDVLALTDITERKEKEEEIQEKALKYRVERGGAYLVKEKKLHKGMDLLMDLVGAGYDGMVVTRTHPEEVREMCKCEVPVTWLSERRAGYDTVAPEFAIIEDRIKEFTGRNKTVLLDRLDYLISQKGFDRVLGFVQSLGESFYIAKGVLILSIDPQTIDSREVSLLEKETKPLTLKHEPSFSEDIYEILEYVYRQNRVGKKPPHKEISRKFNITSTTERKRINRLKVEGLLVEKKKGRFKVLELTEKGREFF